MLCVPFILDLPQFLFLFFFFFFPLQQSNLRRKKKSAFLCILLQGPVALRMAKLAINQGSEVSCVVELHATFFYFFYLVKFLQDFLQHGAPEKHVITITDIDMSHLMGTSICLSYKVLTTTYSCRGSLHANCESRFLG